MIEKLDLYSVSDTMYDNRLHIVNLIIDIVDAIIYNKVIITIQINILYVEENFIIRYLNLPLQ